MKNLATCGKLFHNTSQQLKRGGGGCPTPISLLGGWPPPAPLFALSCNPGCLVCADTFILQPQNQKWLKLESSLILQPFPRPVYPIYSLPLYPSTPFFENTGVKWSKWPQTYNFQKRYYRPPGLHPSQLNTPFLAQRHSKAKYLIGR